MLHLFNMCWTSYEIPAEWKSAKVISLFKKGERNKTENYRGISLLNAAYKLYSRIINERLRTISETILLEEQAGFRKGRSCTDDVFSLRQIIQQRREFNLETHIAFIDYLKAFDRIHRDKLWHIMEKRGYPMHLIRTVQALYKKHKIIIETYSEELT